MRVLIVNYEYPPLGGGSSTATAEMAKLAANLGHQIVVLTAGFRNLPRKETLAGHTVVRIPAIRFSKHKCTVPEMISYILSAFTHAPRLVREFEPDVVWAVNGIPSGPIALELMKLLGVPYLVLLRDGEVPGFLKEKLALYHTLTMPLTKAIWRNASFVVANSRGLRDLALRTTPGLEIKVVPNGVDTRKFHPPKFRGPDVPVRILFLGRLSPQKGVEYLLRAVANLPADIRGSVHLVIVGDGPERRRLEQLAARLSVDNVTEFRGWADREEVPQLYRAADIYALPSLYEGMPNTLLEAMASGLAVVATDVAGSEELVRSGDNGLLVPPRDPAALTAALEQLISSPELRRNLGRAAREFVAQSHDWERITQQHLSLSREAMRRERNSG